MVPYVALCMQCSYTSGKPLTSILLLMSTDGSGRDCKSFVRSPPTLQDSLSTTSTWEQKEAFVQYLIAKGVSYLLLYCQLLQRRDN